MPPSPGDVQVLERWQLTANHLLSSTHNALQSVYVPGGGGSEPHSDGGGQNRLNDGCVELHQHLGQQLELLQLPQKVHALLGLLDGADGQLPLEVLGDNDTQEVHNRNGGVYQGEGGTVEL